MVTIEVRNTYNEIKTTQYFAYSFYNFLKSSAGSTAMVNIGDPFTMDPTLPNGIEDASVSMVYRLMQTDNDYSFEESPSFTNLVTIEVRNIFYGIKNTKYFAYSFYNFFLELC